MLGTDFSFTSNLHNIQSQIIIPNNGTIIITSLLTLF